MNTSENANDSTQYITFTANGQEFASSIMAIREIRGWVDTTKLPHVPDYVRGVINLRGTVLPVVDLKARLGLGLTDATIKHVIMVVHAEGKTSGILVESVSDIITLKGADIQPPPDVMGNVDDNCISGIAVIENRMVTLLGIADLMASVTRDLPNRLIN